MRGRSSATIAHVRTHDKFIPRDLNYKEDDFSIKPFKLDNKHFLNF